MGSGGYIKTKYIKNNNYEEYINNDGFTEQDTINETNDDIINICDYENEIINDFNELVKDIKSMINSYFTYIIKLFRLNYKKTSIFN